MITEGDLKSDDMNAHAKENDTTYFSSYEDLDIHELMLKDRPRTLAYKEYMEKNAELIEGKVVVDVGAGTGILSLFAAKAGAKKVYAVEASNLSIACRKIVETNNLCDVITVIQGRVEDVDLPNNIKADIIISEWMGFYLLHESMLDSLVVARDKWLSEDGLMVPSNANLYLCPVNMSEYHKEHFGFWDNVYGFDFSPLLPAVRQKALSQPVISVLDAKQCLAEREQVLAIDLKFVTREEVSKIISNPTFTLTKNGIMHGFACWFDVEFEGVYPVVLSTAPGSASTHWKQTALLLPDALLVSEGTTIGCKLELSQDADYHRRYNISIELNEEDYDDEDDEDDDEDDSGNQAEEILDTNAVRELLLKTMKQHAEGATASSK